MSWVLNDDDEQYNNIMLSDESGGDVEDNNIIAIVFGGNYRRARPTTTIGSNFTYKLGISEQTGVSITTDAHIRRLSRRQTLRRTRLPRPRNHSIMDYVIQDEENRAELGQHENGSDSPHGMNGLSTGLSSGHSAEPIGKHITWSCDRCRRRFVHHYTLPTHRKYYKGHVPTTPVKRAKLMLSDIIESEDSHIFSSTARNPDLVCMEISECL